MEQRFGAAAKTLKNFLGQPKSYTAPWVGLKQVVDCRLPTRASYQSIVMQGMELKRLKPPEISHSPFKVKVSRYEALPIVQTLGLKVSNTEPGVYTTIDTIEAAFGVWIRADVEAQPAVNVCSREGDSPWHHAKYQKIKDRLYNQDILAWIGRIVRDALLAPLRLIGMFPGPWWPKLPRTVTPVSKGESRQETTRSRQETTRRRTTRRRTTRRRTTRRRTTRRRTTRRRTSRRTNRKSRRTSG